MLFDVALLEEGLLRLGKIFPLLCQGAESFLVGAPELFCALLNISAGLCNERFAGLQLGLPGAVERQ